MTVYYLLINSHWLVKLLKVWIIIELRKVSIGILVKLVKGKSLPLVRSWTAIYIVNQEVDTRQINLSACRNLFEFAPF